MATRGRRGRGRGRGRAVGGLEGPRGENSASAEGLPPGVEALQAEMAAMRREQQERQEELEQLRRENAEIRNMYRSWRPSEQTGAPTEGDQYQPPTYDTHASRGGTSRVADPSEQGGSRPTPFARTIVDTPLPDNWKGVSIDKYDGTSDPDEHLDIYTTQMNLYTSSDAVLCRVFPTSLKGAALSWFTRLPPYAIHSFEELAAKFTTQFATSRPHHLTSVALLTIRQEKNETLRSFMERFGKVTLNIRNLDPAVALHHLVTALRPSAFVDSLCKKPATSMDDLRRRAAKYMQMEELVEFRKQAATSQNERREADNRKRGRDRYLKEAEQRGPKYAHYTPLTANRAVILDQALNTNVIQQPRKAMTPPRADTRRYCRYHRNHGHTTEECTALMNRIEELIQTGELSQFVQRGGDRGGRGGRGGRGRGRGAPNNRDREDRPRQEDPLENQERERNQDLPPPKRVINTIAGGFAGGGSSNAARKKHLRIVQSVNAVGRAGVLKDSPPITFTSRDFKGVDPIHDDPMVISVET